MKNKDVLVQEKALILQQMNDAIVKNDPDAFAAAFEKLSLNIQENILNEVAEQQQAADTMILAGRGVRQLTSEETKYFQAVIEAMKSSNPQQALTDLEVVMPKTVIDRVFEDLTQQHPLLDDFGDLWYAGAHGNIFIHSPVKEEVREDLEAAGFRVDFCRLRSKISEEPEAVLEFSDDCIFWAARKPD